MHHTRQLRLWPGCSPTRPFVVFALNGRCPTPEDLTAFGVLWGAPMERKPIEKEFTISFEGMEQIENHLLATELRLLEEHFHDIIMELLSGKTGGME